MQSIVGIFNSLADATRAAAMLRTLGIAEDRITVLSPHTPEAEIEAQIPTTDTEQPGMGRAMADQSERHWAQPAAPPQARPQRHCWCREWDRCSRLE